MQPNQPQQGSKISNTEWALVIGAGFLVDAIQILLDFFLIGIFVNWLIDIFVGASLWLYYHIRGVKMDGKKILTLIIGFVLDGLGVGAIPSWGFDIIIVRLLDRADKGASLAPKHSLINTVAKKVVTLGTEAVLGPEAGIAIKAISNVRKVDNIRNTYQAKNTDSQNQKAA